jgi:hypothetical protein
MAIQEGQMWPRAKTFGVTLRKDGVDEIFDAIIIDVLGGGASVNDEGGGVGSITIPGSSGADIATDKNWRGAIAFRGANTPTFVGIVAHTTGGTAASQTPTTTNARTGRARIQYTSGAATNNNAGMIANANNGYFIFGNAAGIGGFTYVSEFGLATLPASTRGFYGLTNGTNPATGGEPSAATDIIGYGWNTGDTTWQFYTNDNAGTITRVNTTVSLDTSTIYRIVIHTDANGANVSVRLYSVTWNGGLTLLYEANPTTQLPTGTIALNPVGYANTSAGSSAVITDFMWWRGAP